MLTLPRPDGELRRLNNHGGRSMLRFGSASGHFAMRIEVVSAQDRHGLLGCTSREVKLQSQPPQGHY